MGQRAGSCQVWASDIDTQVLEKAEAGVYRQEDLRTLTPTQMQRYFLRGTGPHQGAGARAAGTGGAGELSAAEPAGAGWALPGAVRRHFCRNVMIYFDKATQERILHRFVPLLKPGG